MPVVLGSKSTDKKVKFGGYEGRRLKQGDIIYKKGNNLYMNYVGNY